MKKDQLVSPIFQVFQTLATINSFPTDNLLVMVATRDADFRILVPLPQLPLPLPPKM